MKLNRKSVTFEENEDFLNQDIQKIQTEKLSNFNSENYKRSKTSANKSPEIQHNSLRKKAYDVA